MIIDCINYYIHTRDGNSQCLNHSTRLCASHFSNFSCIFAVSVCGHSLYKLHTRGGNSQCLNASLIFLELASIIGSVAVLAYLKLAGGTCLHRVVQEGIPYYWKMLLPILCTYIVHAWCNVYTYIQDS